MDRLKKIKSIRENLAKGKHSIGSWIQIPHASIAEIMGQAAKFEEKEFLDAMQKIKTKADKAKIPCGVHIVEPDKSELKKKIADGYRFIAYSIDAVVLETFTRNPSK